MQLTLESLYTLTINLEKGIENQTISTLNVINDLDSLIALRKEKRQCTQHPLTNFVSFDTCHSHIEHLLPNLAL